ncbi:Kelch-like protein terF [Colletotrichum sidae]|uniref:Kelch-like protein terF n=1 Tax=Colletotrichum sidae TaxID=1347389 RepID=A0A4R8TQX8_9PEZI|nr:Kelch-like protein terF [Colletotrichum sidae]
MRIPPFIAIVSGVSGISQARDAHLRSRESNGTTESWKDLAQIPDVPRQEHTAVAINSSTIAIVGGITGTTESGAWLNSNLLSLYDIPTNTWTNAAPLPVALNHPNAAVVDGKIYLLGGLAASANETGTWRATPESWVYDAIHDVWTPTAPFPLGTERGSAAVGVSGKTIYLAGGLRYIDTSTGGTMSTVDEVSAFDTASGTWTSFTSVPLPQPRDHAGGAVVDNKFYVIGGRHIAGRLIVSDTVYVLDLGDVEAGWTSSSAVLPTARAGHATAVIGNRIYTFGGEGDLRASSGVFGQSEVLCTSTGSWKSLGAMQHPRHGGAAVAVDGAVYIPGGGVAWGATPVNIADVFRP